MAFANKKTFIFKPSKKIFGGKLLDNQYAWVRAEKAKVILLQDLASVKVKNVIASKDLLLLLEALSSKKFAKDFVKDTDVPIFAMSKSQITYKGPLNLEDEHETDMMSSRCRIIKFKHVVEEKDQGKIKPCGSYFTDIVQ